jgi:transcription elongation factor/antiterminator RfaH
MSVEPRHSSTVERDEGSRWRLVRAITGREVFAAEQLERQGFVTFLPKQLKTVRHARKVRIALGAYFPGYLFVELDLAKHRWRSVNGTLGVSHLIGSEDRPTPVPRGVVEALIEAADARGVLTGPPLEAGQKVRILAGAFADKLAVIERQDEAGRVRVLLDIINRQVAVSVSRDLLSATD